MITRKIIAVALVVALSVSAVWIWASIRVVKDYMWETRLVVKPRQTAGPPGPAEAKVMEFLQATTDHIDEEIYYDSLEYLAQAVEAESGNQGYKGKRLVARVIINRYSNDAFPDDYYSVINQKNQFEVVSNGMIWREPSEETYRAVADELKHCSDERILFFTAGQYNASGTPLYRYKDHYFSGR